jgi:CheY-like chemotaxis protein
MTDPHPAPGGGPAPDKAAFLHSLARHLNQESRLVMVVDDEPGFRRLVVHDLQRMAPDILTVEAANGEEALRKLADVRDGFRCDPALIILDLRMPVLDGWQLLAALKQDYQDRGRAQGIPVIVMSSTPGERGIGPFRQSIHGDACDYVPLVSVAKDACVRPQRYDAVGEKGLLAWARHFLG